MSTEAILVFLLNILIVVFIAVGIYLLFLLTQIHDSVRRANRILEKGESLLDFLEEKIIKPGSNIANYFGVAREFFGIAVAFKNALKKKSESTGK